MKINKDILKTRVTYIIEENDHLEISTKGKITKIKINNKEISNVTKFLIKQSVYGYAKLYIEKLFTQDDFEEIKKYY